MMITVGYICYRGHNHVLIMNLGPGGMTIVQQQGMEVLGVNLSPSVSFKDRIAVRPRVMLNACLLSRVSIRGTLTDARNKTICTQDETLD